MMVCEYKLLNICGHNCSGKFGGDSVLCYYIGKRINLVEVKE